MKTYIAVDIKIHSINSGLKMTCRKNYGVWTAH